VALPSVYRIKRPILGLFRVHCHHRRSAYSRFNQGGTKRERRDPHRRRGRPRPGTRQ